MANITYRESTTPTVPGTTTAKLTPLTNLEVDANFKSLNDDIVLRAPILNPTFTGTPAAPTAATGTATTQLATTAFVTNEIANDVPSASETVAGRVELASAAETTTGTDALKAVHPAGLKVELDKKITKTGAFTAALTVTANTAVTLPATGTLATLAGSETLTNKTIAGATNNVEASSLKSATTTVSVSAATAPSTGQVLTATSGSAATWQSPAGGDLVLLATVTPTVAANIDFLNTFNSSYDNYLVIGDGITFGSDEGLDVRIATAGAVDVAGNCVRLVTNDINQSTLTSRIQIPGNATIRSGGKGCNFSIEFFNANTATNHKGIFSKILWNDVAASTSYVYSTRFSAYVAANTISGFQLISTLGGNFAATGIIRVYGYKNT